MGLVRPGISRAHRLLLIAVLAFLAAAATTAATRRLIVVYDTFVGPQVVFVRATPGGPASSISISANATPAQIQRAVGGGTPTWGWSSVPGTSWVSLGLFSMMPAAAWLALALVVWRPQITQRWLVNLTAIILAAMTAVAVVEVVVVARDVMRRT